MSIVPTQQRGTSYLVVGPAGSGKSRWIRQQAAAAKQQLFRWNCRDDRALRQGRELLHGIVRTREPTWVWLEGADDITLDAQAFLRRILETASPHVTCALEVRRLECMAEPIQSRCILRRILPPETISHRQMHHERFTRFPEDATVPDVSVPTNLTELRQARMDGADPLIVLQAIAKRSEYQYEALKRASLGASPWILSAWMLAAGA